MARRRGFFAELQHQARVAEQKERAAQRQYDMAVRRAEQAQRSAERARIAAERASEADRKRLEREAAAAYVAARQAEVERLNEGLAAQYETIDSVLAATLEVDDYVDLESLRARVEHPPFPRQDLLSPLPQPAPIPDPPHPVRRDPEPVRGMFGRKQKEAAAVAAVEEQYARDYWEWHAANESLPARRAAQAEQYAAAEGGRIAELDRAKALYAAECEQREKAVRAQNEDLDGLINGLAYGTTDAVNEYVSIVLANSIYPEGLDVSHTATYEPSTAELALTVVIPGPDLIPTTKSYRYVKAGDEIAETQLAQKDVKERYAGIVNNVALRSLHEVFEADRRGVIRSISLEVATDATNPATGRLIHVPLAAVSTDRETFLELDLNAVVPSATLAHLGAVVSKNPVALTPVSGAGVRKA
ncbi:hypothetical protein NY547_19060 [Cnuibacter physcomitrellae]|uniref:hypothetical protein n=1 Tax=Cnuibacter physcomitrellae TaxID=1619308 RepID=UPI002175CB6E|nr:hypothetical protein [Cnuibacter physcomitrellae]MCS5499347.1 hypothetical protein [Cnuibacter physcomitrellae]